MNKKLKKKWEEEKRSRHRDSLDQSPSVQCAVYEELSAQRDHPPGFRVERTRSLHLRVPFSPPFHSTPFVMFRLTTMDAVYIDYPVLLLLLLLLVVVLVLLLGSSSSSSLSGTGTHTTPFVSDSLFLCVSRLLMT